MKDDKTIQQSCVSMGLYARFVMTSCHGTQSEAFRAFLYLYVVGVGLPPRSPQVVWCH